MRARWIFVVASAYGLALALIGLWPTPVDRNLAVVELPAVAWTLRRLGLEPWEGYHLIEFSANIVLFIPLGVLVLLWRIDWSWRRATLLAFAVTVTIEALQNIVRPERFASVGDVVANTLGGAIGALLIVVARARVPALRR